MVKTIKLFGLSVLALTISFTFSSKSFAEVKTKAKVAAKAAGNPFVGYWKTIDDKTKKIKSVVQIREVKGVLYGKIIKLFRKASENQCPKCTKCKKAKKDKPTCGMQILWGLKKSTDIYYKGGKILDPNNGKTYTVKLWFDKDKKDKIGKVLKVRGYVLFFYRTQTWYKTPKPTKKTCALVCKKK